MKAWIVALALLFTAGSASAQSAQGFSALAFGVILGGYSPRLSAQQKTVLNAIISGHGASVAHAGKIVVKVDAIDCRAGDVDITAFSCTLTFGGKTRQLSGRSAHELFATLGEVGVQSDGAAGTIHMAATKVSCTIDPLLIAGNGGGGADCSYTP